MSIQILNPQSVDEWLAMRALDVTSTEVSCLKPFGCNPYITEFELYHRKKTVDPVTFVDNRFTLWGRRLEGPIAKGIAEDHQWDLRPMKEYIRDDELRLGASFDYEVNGKAILEIKNVDANVFRNQWILSDRTIEPPPHIELQVQQQLLLSKKDMAYIGVLIGGNRVEIVKRKPNPKIHLAIIDAVKKFWQDVNDNIEPAVNFEKDADFIKQLYSYAEPGKVLEANRHGSSLDSLASLARRFTDLGSEERKIKKERDALRAEMLTLIGDHEKVLGDGFTITANTVGPQTISYEREPYRQFRVYWKKTKKD